MTHDRDDAFGRLLRQSLTSGSAPGTCPDAETLAAWADSLLRGEDRSRVERHLADCPRCQVHMAALVRMSARDAHPAPRGFGLHSWRWLVPATAGATALALWILVTPEPPVEIAQETKVARDAPATAPPLPPSTPQAAPAAPAENREGIMGDRRRAQQAPPSEESPPQPLARAEEPSRMAPDAALEREAQADLQAPAAVPTEMLSARAAPATIVSPDPLVRWRLVGPVVERSVDGGATWARHAEATAPLTAGASPSPTTCWIVGRAGTVLLTTDGVTFTRVPFPEAADLVTVAAADAARASVTTADGRTFSTTDAGKTWRPGPLQELPAAPF